MPGLLLRLLLPLALMLSALPVRAGVVCVERGRVLAFCGMASRPEAPGIHPAPDRRACCRALVPTPPCSPDCSPAGGRHCEEVYRSSPPILGGAHVLLSFPAALAAAPFVFVPRRPPTLTEPSTPDDRAEPPQARPRAPDLGRAPPTIASLRLRA